MNKQRKKAVFLDRDGVINRSLVKEGNPYPPPTLEEVEILPGVEQAIKKLKDAEYLTICVTNQPDVARKTQTREAVEKIHKYLFDLLGLDDIITCYHDDHDKCQCRKPLPGMLLDAVRKYLIDVNNSFMVGDRWRDIEAGRRAGCVTILIDYQYPENKGCQPDVRVSSLLEAVDWILKYEKRGA